MTMPKAVLFGLTMIALAVVFNKESFSQQSTAGLYAVSAAGDNAAWRLNTRTGQVSHCRKEFAGSPAKCGPWSGQ